MKNEWDVRAQNDFIHAVTGNVHKDDFWESGQEIIAELIEPYLERLELNPATSRAMEIGAGAGRVVISLSKTFKSVVAVDVSRTMLDLARKSAVDLDHISFINTDRMQLEGVNDNSIDLQADSSFSTTCPPSTLSRRICPK
jgi:tRNA/tmRNA/rRNA uracil-C5-methylase (TrmA/RlmC/RlmD family)